MYRPSYYTLPVGVLALLLGVLSVPAEADAPLRTRDWTVHTPAGQFGWVKAEDARLSYGRVDWVHLGPFGSIIRQGPSMQFDPEPCTPYAAVFVSFLFLASVAAVGFRRWRATRRHVQQDE